MKISVCLITWNEKNLLAKAVASTEGLADEVVVVDTGSTDGTLALARELGAKVLTGADRMHKAESRNRALNSATGDWEIVLDADEQIADPRGLRSFLESTDADAIYIKLAFVDAQDRPTLSYQQMRCWRRGAYRYKYRAHELPIPTDGWGKVEHTDFVWEHRPPRDRGWKVQYTLERLLLDVEENPDASRPVYYLGRQYMYLRDWKRALETLEKYLDRPGVDAADAWHDIAKCRAKLGDQQGQIEALHRACAVMPGRREWWCELAQLYYSQANYQMAAGLLRCALEIPMPARSYSAHYWYGSGIHDLLARCLWKLKRYEEGYEQALTAVELRPDEQRLWDNLTWFEGKLGQAPGSFMTIGPTTTQGLKVLMLAYEDYSGKAHGCMEAFNEWAEGEHRARLVTWKESYLKYNRDIFVPSAEKFRLLVEWADVVHVYDQYPWHVGRWGKPLVVTYSGSHYRHYNEWLNAMDTQLGAVQLCSTLDLAAYGSRWCPRPMGALPAGDRPSDRFVVSHAPTRRNENKGTEEIIRQLSELDGVELDVIERVSNAGCLERKGRSHLYIDQFLMGYGTNALEAWAMGIPVIAGVGDPDLLERMEGEIGPLPFVMTELKVLRAMVERLRDDAQFYEDARVRGVRYVQEFHSPKRIGSLLWTAYQEAMERGPASDAVTGYYDLVLESARMDAFYRKRGALVHEKRKRHRHIAELVQGESVLDVGCGTGDLLLLLQRNGYERLAGIDISGVALEMARERGVQAELLHTADVPEGPFSTIVMSQVLEHVLDDRALVKAAASQLEDNGLLIASVPMDDRIPAADHRREYSEASLIELLGVVGETAIHEWDDSYRLLVTARKV